MSGKRYCSVPNCFNVRNPQFSLPVTENVLSAWLERIGDPSLKAKSVKEVRRLCLGICKTHFANVCIAANDRLKRYALPTLNLPKHYDSTLENCFMFYKEEVPEKEKLEDTSVNIAPPADPGVSSCSPSPKLKIKEHGLKTYTRKPRQLFIENNVDKEVVTPSTDVNFDDIAPLSNVTLDEERIIVTNSDVIGASTSKVSRESLLKKLGVKKIQLSPKKRYLYKHAMQYKRNVQRMKMYNVKKRLFEANKLLEKESGLVNVNKITRQFFMLQQRTQKQKPQGRRFSVEDKLLSLAIYKQSGKGYKFLSKIFSLPSRQTLVTLLNKIPFGAGVNSHIFEHLKSVITDLNPDDRYCTLIFDEISLSPGLEYNRKLDAVDGFVDYGDSTREAAFADHALLFMVRGIRRKWKQPVCFTFCEGTTPSTHLSRILKQVIRQVLSTGLKIVATVCDQAAANQKAINNLLKETEEFCYRNNTDNRYYGFLIDNVEIVPLYDFPHLMKGIRNNLLTKDLHYSVDGVAKVATWKHIVQLFESDTGILKACLNLTEEHVIPEKIKKMSVRCCTQVFSRNVAEMMSMLAKHNSVGQALPVSGGNVVDPKATETAELLLFFDKLFDSVNGSCVKPPNGKVLRCAVTDASDHLESIVYETVSAARAIAMTRVYNRRHVPPQHAEISPP